MPITFADTIANNALQFGDHPAFVFAERTLSHRELYGRARKIAQALIARGIRPQDRVAMLSQNRAEFCELYAATELSRTILTTVNFRLAPIEMAHIVNDSSAKILIFEDLYAAVVEGLRATLPGIEHYVCIGASPPWAEAFEDLVATGNEQSEIPAPNPDDIAYLIYTSGTTGKPKGCMVGHRAVMRYAEVVNYCIKAGPTDRMLLVMPFFHIGSKTLQLGQHLAGGTIHVHRNFDAEALLRTLQDERITIALMAPTMIQMLLEQPAIHEFDLSSLKTFAYSAAPMPLPTLRKGLDLFGPIFLQMYGQTEGAGTLLPAAAHKPDGDERDLRRLRSIGFPFPGVRARIVDESGVECPQGTPGEIVLQSEAVMSGYWNNSAATIEALRDGWLHTGDIGVVDEDGYHYLVDRKKDVIISGGENIYSREVEDAVYQHTAVAEVAVIGIPDAKWGETVRAVVVLKPGATATENDIVEHCRTLIAGYKRPRSVVFVEALPKLASGKINKPEIRRLHGAP